MYLLVSTLIDDGNSVLSLNVEKTFVSDDLTNLGDDELEQSPGYQLLQKLNQYILFLRFHPEKRNESLESNFLSLLSLIPLDVAIVKELLAIAFSDNPNLADISESINTFLRKRFPNLMNSLEFVNEKSYNDTISFECSLVEDKTVDGNSYFMVCGYAVDYGGRGPDDDFKILNPIMIKTSPVADKFMKLLVEEDGIDNEWLKDFKEKYGEIEELCEIFEESQYYDTIYLQEFELY